METLNASLSTLLASMPPTLRTLWGLFALLMLLAIMASVRWERRRYVARNQALAWLLLRIATLPIIVASAAVVVLPSRAISGLEALAAAYLLAFSLGPLVFFGLHWLVAAVVGLSRRDAFAIGGSGLLILIVPLLLASQAQRWFFEIARAVDGSGAERGSPFVQGPQKPQPLQIVNQQRFTVPEIGELWTERWKAPAGVQVERVELKVRGQFVAVDDASSNYLCKTGADIDVLWHGAVAPAQWRVHWRDANGQRAHSEWMMTPPAQASVPFTPDWLSDGVALPVRVPAAMVSYQWMRENGQEDSRSAARVGLAADAGCVETLRRAPTANEALIIGVGIRIWRFDTQQMLYAQLRRPGPDTNVAR